MSAFVFPILVTSVTRPDRAILHRSARRCRTHYPTGKASYRRAIVCQLSGNGVAPEDATLSKNASSSPKIQLMACDMDGTMLNSEVNTSERNIATVKRLIDETDVLFVPATGKSRAGALNAMGELGDYLKKTHPGGCPGVFLQGLIVYGKDGQVVYEDTCDEKLSRAVVAVAEDLELTLIGYSRDSIVCTKRDEFVDLLPTYREPNPEVVESWDMAIAKKPLNKFIYMALPEHIDKIRPLVAERIGDLGHLTQAQGNMLEVLPPSASKGFGVRELIKSFNIHPDNVLAIGDAENDLEMLEMVGYSCAVENALPAVKEASKYTDLSSNDEDGVSEAIDRFIFTPSEVNAVA